MAHRPLHLAVAGATSLVGRALLELLEEREVPVASLRLLDADTAAGERLPFRGDELAVEAVKDGAFGGRDIAILVGTAAEAREWAPRARSEGALVVDDSDAFRAELDVPLLVPQVNPDAILGAKARGIAASANVLAAALSVVLRPLASAAGLEHASVVSLQAVSGAGQAGLDQLEREARSLLSFEEPEGGGPFPVRIAFNLVPAIGAVAADGRTEEERQLAEEPRRILGLPDLRISATAVRVPLFYGHSAAVNVATRRKLAAVEARELLRKAPGVKVLDAPGEGVYPMPMLAVVDDAVEVGRIREDASQERGLDLFLSVDNVRRAAANLVAIAALLAERVLHGDTPSH
jgi:aspartate-semialdehyde dehydrogenase